LAALGHARNAFRNVDDRPSVEIPSRSARYRGEHKRPKFVIVPRATIQQTLQSFAMKQLAAIEAEIIAKAGLLIACGSVSATYRRRRTPAQRGRTGAFNPTLRFPAGARLEPSAVGRGHCVNLLGSQHSQHAIARDILWVGSVIALCRWAQSARTSSCLSPQSTPL